MAASRWFPLLITWPITTLLARLLTPQDYGYLAVVTVFTRFGRIVAEAGVANTIVLGPELSEVEYRAVHGFSIGVYLLVAFVLCGLALPLQAIYERPGMAAVIWTLSVGLVFDGISLVPTALLRRRLQFRETAFAEFIRVLSDSFGTLTLAILGMQYWSLVYGYLGGALAGSLAISLFAGIRPSIPNISIVRKVRARASRLLTASMATFAAQNSDASVGGLVVSAAGLGGYTFMAGLSRSPIEKLSGIVTYASASLFGRIGGETERVGRVLTRIGSMTALVMFPIFAGLGVVAGDLIAIAFGPRWLPFVPAFRLLCLQASLIPLASALDNALVATGHERTLATNALLSLVALPPAFFFLGRSLGATGLALAWLAPLPFVFYRRLSVLRGAVGVGGQEWLKSLLMPALATLAMAVSVLMVDAFPAVQELRPVLRLGLSVGLGLVTYIVAAFALCSEQIEWFAGLEGTGGIGRTVSRIIKWRRRIVNSR